MSAEFKAEDVEFFNEALDEYRINTGDQTPFWKLDPDKQRQLIQIALNKCYIEHLKEIANVGEEGVR